MSKKLTIEERRKKLLSYLKSISEDGEVGGIQTELESAINESSNDGFELEVATQNNHESRGLEVLDVIETDKQLNDEDLGHLEAIIHKVGRPVIDVVNDTYMIPRGKWKNVLKDPYRSRIHETFTSIGRIELPADSRPYAGTGFLVGNNLLMTTRHVAWLFSQGIGTNNLVLDTSQEPGIDFKREIPRQSSPPPVVFDIEDVVMIHPHFDMALLHVNGIDQSIHKPLKLNAADPSDLWGSDVVTVGYPAFDPRNDKQVQFDIFERVFEVKRMAPGQLTQRIDFQSNNGTVNTIAHDCSTLGGNSGSCLLSTTTGEVVGLHFAGEYLGHNYAVSMHDLAKDSRVVDAGVIFEGNNIPRDDFYGSVWQKLEREKELNNEPKKNEGLLTRAPDVTPYLENMSIDSIEEESFSWATALSSALASHVVYFNESKLIEQVEDAWGFDYCQFIKRDNIECFVAGKESGSAIVSFRGSQGKRDWLTNLNMISTSQPYGRVHRGFRSAFMAVKAPIEKVLNSNKVTSVIMTGHSLGGAIATIAAAEWLEWFNNQNIKLNGIYTFGQPAVGKGRFPEFIEEHFSDSIYRFVNDDDIVTRLPPTYWHVGNLYHFDSSGHLNQLSETSYIDRSQESMLSERELDQLKLKLLQDKLNGSSPHEEGFLPSFSDHSIAHYIRRVSCFL